MKKRLTILFVILATIFAVVVFFQYEKWEENQKEPVSNMAAKTETVRMVKVNGKVYYDTGKVSEELRCGMMDGKISSHVEENQIPTEDKQANFAGDWDFQYGRDHTIEVRIEKNWCIFEERNEEGKAIHSFYGKIVEAGLGTIVVEPNEGEEIRKSASRVSVSYGKHSDMVYQLGTNVKITYAGEIRETEPAQVDGIQIEIRSVEDFALRFSEKQPQTDKKVYKILDAKETPKQDYAVYTYCGSANIILNGEEMSLRNALLEDKITMNEIIAKANQDVAANAIQGEMYRDGGSMLYRYERYSILKCHRLDGNRDVYIGTPDLDIDDVIE